MPTFECKVCMIEIEEEANPGRLLYCAECGKALDAKAGAKGQGATRDLQLPPGRIGGTLLDMAIPEDLKKPPKKK